MDEKEYSKIRKNTYEVAAKSWTLDNRNPVVGSFDAHNKWDDYEYLFVNIPKEIWKNMNVLDFGTGPGRNIVKYSSRFRNIDGVDIGEINLVNARIYLESCSVTNNTNLFLCNGYDLRNISNSSYDLVMSTIAFQHIPVYNIRRKYLEEFFRVLNNGGYISFQMGYGPGTVTTVPYHANFYDAGKINGSCDVEITSPKQIEDDLTSIGFTNFTYHIGPVGPGDHYSNWIYFTAQKP